MHSDRLSDSLPQRSAVPVENFGRGQGRDSGGWVLLLCGIVLWTAVQTTLVAVPIWTRSFLPEPDDSVSYLVKNRQMEECFFQDCLALQDLREQFSAMHDNPEIRAQQGLAQSRIFPVYHLLFSLICNGIVRLGFDHVTVYKIVWTLGPFFFGLAFAALLSALWGRAAAGLTLMMLAFKIFPDTGLHYVVPSNLAMALATALLARLVTTGGHAPITLVLGAIAVMGMHTIGRLYAVILAVGALILLPWPPRLRTWTAPLIVLGLVAWTFHGLPVVGTFGFTYIPVIPSGPGESPILKILMGAGQTIFTVIAEVHRLETSLLGAVPVFFGALVLGFCAVPVPRRIIIAKVAGMYALFLLALCFYVSSHPADVVLRVWIPFVVMVFGAVGYALLYAVQKSRAVLGSGAGVLRRDGWRVTWAWPLVLAAVLGGYVLQMMVNGAVHVILTAKHMRERQPIALHPSQPAKLLAEASPGDRVLYGSMIIMPYYFVHGAMKLGAVYYHPVMENNQVMAQWLNRPDLRFAVMYNPTMYHPSFEGRNETDWWITSPEYRYTALSHRRQFQPLAPEGQVPASAFWAIEITPQVDDFPRTLVILFRNPGKAQRIEITPLNRDGSVSAAPLVHATVPAGQTGRLSLELPSASEARGFRIRVPDQGASLKFNGFVFGNDPLHWPWGQRADITFRPKDGITPPVTVHFDPARILPKPLSSRKITVLDDSGSSVLFKIAPQ